MCSRLGGLGVFLLFLIRGLKIQIFSLERTLDLQKQTLDIMEKRIAETEKVGAIYKRFLEDLPKDLDNYRAVVLQLRDEAISALQKENRRLLDREFNLKSETLQNFWLCKDSLREQQRRNHRRHKRL